MNCQYNRILRINEKIIAASYQSINKATQYRSRKETEILLKQRGYNDPKYENSFFEWSKKNGDSHDIALGEMVETSLIQLHGKILKILK